MGYTTALWTYLLVLCISTTLAQIPSTLRLVQMVSRHGERTPRFEVGPNDPYQESFWPQGFGQLTIRGMQQHFERGQYLKKRYVGFIDEKYNRYQIYARSTDRDRTLMSSLSSLAGMFPPDGAQTFNPNISWQPIPVHTRDITQDPYLSVDPYCGRWNQLYDELMATDQTILSTQAQYQDVFDELFRAYGRPVPAKLHDVWEIWDPLYVQRLYNLTWPDWMTEDTWQLIDELQAMKWKYRYLTDEMAKIQTGGMMTGLFISTIKSFLNGTTDPRMRMYTYSSHDTAITAMMRNLKIFRSLPPFAATIIIELHETSPSNYAVSLLYKNETGDGDPYDLIIPGCEAMCPWQKFLDLTKDEVLYSMDEWREVCKQKIAWHMEPLTLAVIVVFVILICLLLAGLLLCCIRRMRQRKDYHHRPMYTS